MKKILLVEDEQLLLEIVSEYFTREGYDILTATDGVSAIKTFESQKVDLVLLDIMIPGQDGFAVCKRIRSTSDVPIIMLTARSEDEDKLLGFELGADEYVTKPFSPKVLVARAKALLKRVEGTTGDGDRIRAGIVELHPPSREVWVEGEPVALSPKEYDLLYFLVQHRNTCMSRDAILDNVWGYDYFGGLRTVDTHVKKLRNKLGPAAKLLRTVVRAGYKFEVRS